MNKKKLFVMLLFCLSMFFTFTICGLTASAATTLELGERDSLYASQEGEPSYGSGKGVSRTYIWSISDTNVLELVDKDGRYCYIRAVGVGTATVSCKVSMRYEYYDSRRDQWLPGYETQTVGSWKYEVKKAASSSSSNTSNNNNSSNSSSSSSASKTVAIKSLKLNKTSLTLNVEKSATLKCTISPKNATSSVYWKSSNSNIASITKGKITAKNPGKATITVYTSNGKKKTCKVTVKAPAKKVNLSSSSLKLGKGDKYTLSATVTPANTTDKLKWSTSNAKIASVNSKGKITTKKAGKVTITATCGSKKAKCVINVSQKAIKNITPVSKKVSLSKGTSATLKYELSPSGSTGVLTWSSNNTSVATVNQKGKVTAIAPGTAVIKVKSSSGKSTEYTVTVTIPATGVSLSRTSVQIGKNKSFSLSATVKPFNTTDKLVWSSGNSNIAKVSSNGTVTGVAEGSTWIKATAGSCSAKCTVTVKNEITATSLSITPNDPAVILGETLQLQANISGPENMTDTVSLIKWTSSNSSVASVDASGKITGRNVGTAVITATLRSMKATYNIRVTQDVWADLSASSVTIHKNYAEISPYKKIYFDTVDGLTLFQSDPAKTNAVSFKGSDTIYDNPRRIILDGVHLTTISNMISTNVEFYLPKGTESVIDTNVLARVFIVDGEGTLHINEQASDPCIETSKSIMIRNGNVFLHRKHTSQYAMLSESVNTKSGANVYISGSSNLYYGTLAESIASGTIHVMTESSSSTLSKIQISGSKTSLITGSSLNLTCNAYYGSQAVNISSSAVWSSSNTAVATVSSSGVVQAKKNGSVTITASYGGKSTSYSLKINDGADISKGTITVYNGYYTQGISSEKLYFNPSEGLRIVQSTSETNYISIDAATSAGYTKLILSGVQIEGIGDYMDNSYHVIVEQEAGTINRINGSIYLSDNIDLTIQGSGTLYATTYGPALRARDITVKNGKVISTTTSEYGSSILAYGTFSISKGAHVTDRRYLPNNAVLSYEEPLISAGLLTIESNQ